MKPTDFKKIFSNLKLPKRREYRTISSKARHDWKLIIVLFIFASLFAISWDVYLFWKINDGSIFENNQEAPPRTKIVSKRNLEDTVKYFNESKVRLDDLLNNKPNAIDPSL